MVTALWGVRRGASSGFHEGTLESPLIPPGASGPCHRFSCWSRNMPRDCLAPTHAHGQNTSPSPPLRDSCEAQPLMPGPLDASKQHTVATSFLTSSLLPGAAPPSWNRGTVIKRNSLSSSSLPESWCVNWLWNKLSAGSSANTDQKPSIKAELNF